MVLIKNKTSEGNTRLLYTLNALFIKALYIQSSLLCGELYYSDALILANSFSNSTNDNCKIFFFETFRAQPEQIDRVLGPFV